MTGHETAQETQKVIFYYESFVFFRGQIVSRFVAGIAGF